MSFGYLQSIKSEVQFLSNTYALLLQVEDLPPKLSNLKKR